MVVDNNSSDRTAEVVRQVQQCWRQTECCNIALRYCFEAQQGLAFARRRAVQEVHSPLIGFLDDDTLPAPDWVEAAIRFGDEHPEAGAYGSSIEGLYEVAPPPGFERIASCLAVIDRGNQPFCYNAERGVLPAGAGMVIRKQAWLEQVPDMPILSGVKAGSLAAKGEDVETLSYIRQAWSIWHNPAMQLQHLIPKERLTRDYLRHLFWQIGLSRYPLRRLRYQRWQWFFMAIIYCLNDFRKVLLYGLLHVRSRYISTVNICEFSLLWGSFLSPVFYRRDRTSHTAHPTVQQSRKTTTPSPLKPSTTKSPMLVGHRSL